MIAKVFLFFAVVAAAHGTLIGSGIAPGLLNAGILAPGLALKGGPLWGAPVASAINTASVVAIPGAVSSDKRVIGTTGLWGAPVASAVNTASVVSIPGAVSTDKRVIGTNGLLAGVPFANGLVANGLVANGLLGAAPLAWGNGIVSPIGLKGAGLLGAPGIVKTVL